MLHVLKKLQNQQVNKCFHNWRFKTNDQRHKEVEREEACRALRRMMLGKQGRMMEKAWRTWLRCHSTQVSFRAPPPRQVAWWFLCAKGYAPSIIIVFINTVEGIN